MNLYDYPQYYDIAFSFRDLIEEANFLRTCIDNYSNIPVRRLFEVACGTAPHAEPLIKMGYEYVGLDINNNMLEYARQKHCHLHPEPLLIEGDMIKFETDLIADFAYVMLGSLYLNSHKNLHSHFDSMAGLLRPGGIYFLDWCVQFENPLAVNDHNKIIGKLDDITVESTFSINMIDPAMQMYEEIWSVDVLDQGRRNKFEMIEHNRAIYPQEFLLFIDSRDDFEFIGWWKKWDLTEPIKNATHIERPIVIIRRV